MYRGRRLPSNRRCICTHNVALTLLGVERIAMDITMLKRARTLWSVDYLPYRENRANIRKWVKAVRQVRDSGNWLLLKNVERKTEEII